MNPEEMPAILPKLLKLRSSQVLRSEDQYEDMLKTRLARLEAIRSASDVLAPDAQRAIEITYAGASVAEQLQSQIVLTNSVLAATVQERLEWILVTDERICGATEAESADDIRTHVEQVRRKAYQFMRWSLSSAATPHSQQPMSDLLRMYFPAEDEHNLNLLALNVSRLVMSLNAAATRLSLLGPLVDIAKVYRGLFYGGIVNVVGSSLARQQLQTELQGVLIETGGQVVPGLGFVVAIARLLNLSEPDRTLEVVNHAVSVITYLRSYSAAVEEWIAVVEPMPQGLERTRQTVLNID